MLDKLTAIVVAVAAGPTLGDVLNVPGDFPTIQAAIDAAGDGDEVVIAPGTYPGDIDLLGKPITVRGDGGAGAIRIEGGSPVVGMVSGEGADTVLEWVTVAHGTPGLCVDGGGPTIRHCQFVDNDTTTFGGAIRIEDSTPTVSDCVFAENHANIFGSGVYSTDTAHPLIERCTFVDNVADGDGSVYAAGDMTIRECVFSNNEGFQGAAAFVCEGTLEADACIYVGNDSGSFEGTVYSQGPAARYVNSLFVANEGGGGALHFFGPADVLNCTFVDNLPRGLNGVAEVWNLVLWDNGGDQLLSASPEYCNIQGWTGGGAGNIDADPLFAGGPTGTWTQAGAYDDPTLTTTYVDENADYEPGALVGKYVRPIAVGVRPLLPIESNSETSISVLGDFAIWGFPGVQYQIEDYRLTSDSPCIDAASNGAVPEDVTSDLDGGPRFLDVVDVPDTGEGSPPIVDMGPYEFPGIRACAADCGDGDGDVDIVDLLALLAQWGRTGSCDLSGGGAIGINDLLAMLAGWGPCTE